MGLRYRKFKRLYEYSNRCVCSIYTPIQQQTSDRGYTYYVFDRAKISRDLNSNYRAALYFVRYKAG